MNCSHQGDGWCLTCVKELQEERDYLYFFRVNADFGPADQDVIDDLNQRYQDETGMPLPKGWERE
jgi:hypothetical protein